MKVNINCPINDPKYTFNWNFPSISNYYEQKEPWQWFCSGKQAMRTRKEQREREREREKKKKKNLWVIYLNSETSFVLSVALIKFSRTQREGFYENSRCRITFPIIYHHSQMIEWYDNYMVNGLLFISELKKKQDNSINK